MAFFKLIVALALLYVTPVDSCALDIYKCGQSNVIETYDQVKKFKLFVGELEELKMKLNSSLIYLEIDDAQDNILVKKVYNTSKVNNSLYSSEANTPVLKSYAMYIITIIIPQHLPLFLEILCN
jgi:hypothetical protein